MVVSWFVNDIVKYYYCFGFRINDLNNCTIIISYNFILFCIALFANIIYDVFIGILIEYHFVYYILYEYILKQL